MPKLRFPEFRDADGWTERCIGNVCTSFSGGTPNTSQNEYYGGTIPFIRSAEIDRAETELFLTDEGLKNSAAKLVEKGNVLVALYGANSGDVALGKVDGAINQAILCLKSERSNGFIYQYLSYKKRWIIATYLQGGQGNLSGDIVKSISLSFPSFREQQKIAECLSSVDDLMAAQARKVDALKTHKKGLMQQLFPREGETQPRLRFPEFKNSGEWETMSIQEMIDRRLIVGHLDGNHGGLYPKAEEFSPNKEGIPYVSANDFMNGSVDFSKCKRLPIERARLFKKGVAKDGDILFAHNATVGPVAKLDTSEEFVILRTTATYFRCDGERLSNEFLKSGLSSPKFVSQYSRVMSQSTRNQVPITTQRKLALQIPKPPEQQRIADCLSSLDALITAETQKLEGLKTHKKGLMQQLFPSLEETP